MARMMIRLTRRVVRFPSWRGLIGQLSTDDSDNHPMSRNFIEKLTDAVIQLRDPFPVKMLGDIETKASQVRADERPDYGRAQGWSDYYWTQWPSYRTVDRRADLGRLDGSSLVMAVANYTGISLAEALPVVTKPDNKGAQQIEPEHIAADLIRRPNPFSIWADYCLVLGFEWWMGNFYLKKVRNLAGQIVELWHIPHFLVQPRWPGDGGTPTVPLDEADNTFLSHYQYNQPGKAPVLIKRADMVHIKRGVCADNPRKGAGVWDGVLEELYGDNAVARFSAQIMKNMGMVQYLLSPKDGGNVSAEQAMHIKQRWIQLSTGDNANTPMVNPVPIEATKLSFSPDELDLSKLRNVPESRIAGVTGIPAIVLQYIVGLENGHYGAAYEQARQQGYENVIIPIQNHLSEDLTWQVLPELENTKGSRISFDITKVRVLQDDRTELYSRMVEAVRAGVITINQFLTSVGKEPLPEGEIYLIPSTSTPMTIDRIKTIADGTVEPPPVVTPEPAKMAADIDHLLAELERQMKDFSPRA